MIPNKPQMPMQPKQQMVPIQQQPPMTGQTGMPELPQEFFDYSLNDMKNKAYSNDKIPKILQKFMEMDNIAEELDDAQLTEISSVVVEGVEIDQESRTEWTQNMKKAIDLVKEGTDLKETPWAGAANIRFPMVMSACMQFNARTNPEIVKNDKVVSVRLMAPDMPGNIKSKRADRLSSHMSYQLLGQSEHWRSDTDKLLMMLPLLGVVFRKSFFNTITGQPDTVLCLPDDVVINAKTTSLSSAQRITHIVYMSTNEIIENMKAGLFLDYDLDELSVRESIDDTGIKADEKPQETKTARSFTTSGDKEAIYDDINTLYEQERWLDLDGDMYQEPYIVTVHKNSGKVLRIVARYDDSSFEFDSVGKFVKINAIEYFTDFHFIPNPTGSFYSLGFGALLMPINETVNSVLNQLIDAGTLANRQSGFIGSDLRIPKGDFSFRPGEWKQIPSTPGAVIAQNIYPLPIKEPSVVLFNLLQFIITSARQITAVSEMMEGQMPPPNMPATTMMALQEQAQHIYSAILGRIYESLRREFNKLYFLNRKYMQEEETFPMAMASGVIKREDYLAPNYAIFPVADPKVSSSVQRMMQAQSLLDLTRFPVINLPKVIQNYLEVLKIPDPNEYIITNAPPPPEALKTMAQIENIKADTKKKIMEPAAMLMDRELKAIELSNDEAEIQSKSAYYGGQLATEKVDSIVKLTQLNTIASPQQVGTATQEEETITHGTQVQGIPQDTYRRLDQLEAMINQLMATSQQQVMPPPSPQPQQIGPGGPQQANGVVPMPEEAQQF